MRDTKTNKINFVASRNIDLEAMSPIYLFFFFICGGFCHTLK